MFARERDIFGCLCADEMAALDAAIVHYLCEIHWATFLNDFSYIENLTSN